MEHLSESPSPFIWMYGMFYMLASMHEAVVVSWCPLGEYIHVKPLPYGKKKNRKNIYICMHVYTCFLYMASESLGGNCVWIEVAEKIGYYG